MKKICFLLLLTYAVLKVPAQQTMLAAGSRFPDVMITQISNAPVKSLFLNGEKDNKFYILNFWGTWCSPCIPEMDALAKLQVKNNRIRVVAISDDDAGRKAKYLASKPSGLWLATDTTYQLYKMLNLASVGHSAIISPDKMIVAVVRTDSINQRLIDKLLKGETVASNAKTNEPKIQAAGDPFGVDSLTKHSFSIRGYQVGQRPMGRVYFDIPWFKDRRASWFNVGIGNLYRAAYGIKTYGKQEFYDASVKKEEVNGHDMNNKNAFYCVDLLVDSSQKEQFYPILQQYLNQFLPVKVRQEKRMLDVYVLKQKPGATIGFTASTAENSSYGFSGRGFEGTKQRLADFAGNYLSNEMELPVLDETGLTGYYDIKTSVELRTTEGIRKSIDALGLVLEKAQREMPVIVYYK
ncbi:TIGR03435 family protein [Sediminibacterium ginsengisoli]|nr:TIGR03435 family protein [Sediminibacterium ginsengisoli]